MSDPDVIDFLKSREIDLVFDVGANYGQYGRWLRERGYEGRIVSFEPIAEVFAELEEHAAKDPLWDAHRCGLGPEAGEATINVSRSTDFSSILPTRQAADTFSEAANVARTETISIRTLDEMAAGLDLSRAFLKIDTQGFEPHVLTGARDTLPRLRGLQMELPVIHLYEGGWTMGEALETMRKHGFVLSFTSVVNYHWQDPCSVVEFDCIFRLRSAIDD